MEFFLIWVFLLTIRSKERGFSYQEDVPLDMRMDQTTALKAFDLVNEGSLQELTKIIGEYGEEKWAKRIASFIVQARKKKSLPTTGQLVEIIKQSIPSGARRPGPHPDKRTFQALRIAVNQELDVLVPALEKGLQVLKPRKNGSNYFSFFGRSFGKTCISKSGQRIVLVRRIFRYVSVKIVHR